MQMLIDILLLCYKGRFVSTIEHIRMGLVKLMHKRSNKVHNMDIDIEAQNNGEFSVATSPHIHTDTVLTCRRYRIAEIAARKNGFHDLTKHGHAIC